MSVSASLPASLSRILVVEDEPNVGTTLVDRLKLEGYDVQWAKSAAQAIQSISQTPAPRLVLLDVGLPDQSGFEVATEIRRRSPQSAIIFLTAFGNAEDRVRGLELGAEDYVVKPFHFKELLLRIQKGLKRAESLVQSEEGPVQIGKARVHFSRFQAERDGETFPLTHKECLVLRLLYDRQGQVVSRDEILNQAWSEDEYPTPRTVDNFIVKLRKRIEEDPENPTVIRSVRGVGYQLELQKKERS
jgi:DNA-binding response OmpR family regulator